MTARKSPALRELVWMELTPSLATVSLDILDLNVNGSPRNARKKHAKNKKFVYHQTSESTIQRNVFRTISLSLWSSLKARTSPVHIGNIGLKSGY